ncbi:MAG: MazG family protein [Lachnospiraceae bacterium]|nr:MazG family protein [Lachnospiraceae bacterium]
MEGKYTYEDFLDIVAKLRSEEGCPWDRAQTHESLRPCMLEETYEFFASLRILKETGSGENMCEELGDMLLQVVMQSRIAEEEGLFTMEDVVHEISRKMIRRHPHVFGNETVAGAGEVPGNWEEIKRKEKEEKTWIATPLREIPEEQPALTRASKVLKKINKVYEPIPDYEKSLEEIKACVLRMEAKGEQISREELHRELAGILMGVSAIAAEKSVYTEQLLIDTVEEVIRSHGE